MRIGHIEQIMGPVIDVNFPIEGGFPDIHNAVVVYPELTEEELTPEAMETAKKIVLEVALDL